MADARKRYETQVTVNTRPFREAVELEPDPDIAPTWELKSVVWTGDSMVFYWQREIES